MTHLDPEFLAMLVCPVSRQPLREATADELARANAAVAAGGVTSRGGERLTAPLEAALATADGAWLYPIRDGIPILLAAEAVPARAP